MTLIASFCCIVRQIIHKVHAGDILAQTTGVVQVHDVGVVRFVLFGVGLRQLTLSDARDASDKRPAMLVQKIMQDGQFFIPSTKMAAGRGDTVVQDEVGGRGR